MVFMISRIVYTKYVIPGRFLFPKVVPFSRNMSTDKPVEASIRRKLTTSLDPIHLDVMNESYMHNVPQGSETHFKVLVVSSQFENVPLVKRHRLVNSALEEELKTGVHALSIVAKAPSQWDPNGDVTISPSPSCKGGFGK